MTYSFRRMNDLEEDIKYRYSIGGVKLRHDSPKIRRLHNVSWSTLRNIVSLADDGTFLDATAVTPLPTVSPIAGEVYAEIDWPVAASRIYGVRVQSSTTSRWYPLKKVPWAAFHDYQGIEQMLAGFSNQPGPRAYCSRVVPRAPGNPGLVETVGKVMLFPIPVSGNYRLWFMEGWQPQVQDTALFAAQDDVWHEWAIYNTMIKMLGPDADSRKLYPQWAAERKEARDVITATAMRLSDGMAIEPRDARDDGYDPEGRGFDP